MTDWAARIATLEEAAGSGILTIESDGDRQTYRSMDDLMRAIDYAKRQQAAALAIGGVVASATTLAVYCPD